MRLGQSSILQHLRSNVVDVTNVGTLSLLGKFWLVHFTCCQDWRRVMDHVGQIDEKAH